MYCGRPGWSTFDTTRYAQPGDTFLNLTPTSPEMPPLSQRNNWRSRNWFHTIFTNIFFPFSSDRIWSVHPRSPSASKYHTRPSRKRFFASLVTSIASPGALSCRACDSQCWRSRKASSFNKQRAFDRNASRFSWWKRALCVRNADGADAQCSCPFCELRALNQRQALLLVALEIRNADGAELFVLSTS